MYGCVRCDRIVYRLFHGKTVHPCCEYHKVEPGKACPGCAQSQAAAREWARRTQQKQYRGRKRNG